MVEVLILETLPDPVMAWNAELRCTLANAAMRATLGADPRGTRLIDLFTLDLEPTANEPVSGVGNLWEGGPRLAYVVTPTPGGGGYLSCHEPRGTAERERLLVTLQSIGDGVIVTDEQARITMMNAAAEEHSGWALAEVAGKPVGAVFRVTEEMQREPVVDAVAVALDSRKPTTLHDHSLLLAKDGSQFPIAFSAAPVVLVDGTLIGAVLVFRDQRARRRLEEELVRGAKLEAVGDLAGNIAHDFNNVLAAILGSASMGLRVTTSEDRAHRLFTVIDTACQRGHELTEELVTYAKGGAPVLEPVAVGPLIHRAASVALRNGPYTARIRIAPDILPIRGDAGQVRQAIQNLIVNAKESMPEGGKVEICAKNIDIVDGTSLPMPAGRYVEIEVADAGPGLGEADLANVFDPFFPTRPGATGLGLGAVHSIVHRHGGYAAAYSVHGEGSRFVITLPSAEIDAPAEGDPPARPARSVVHRRVLLMDDEPLVRALLANMLEELGYEVDVTEEGDAAVSRYAAALRVGHGYDLVILDLTIPGGKGGVAAMVELMALDPSVCALVSSGYATDPVMASARDHGFAGVLEKPYGLIELQRKLSEVLGEERAPSAQAPSAG